MEAKAIQATRTKLNELAVQHNRLTTLVAVILSEVQSLKEEMSNVKSLLEGVEVVSTEQPEKPSAAPVPSSSHHHRSASQPTVVSQPPPPPPARSASNASSSRSRRNQSLAEIHADDIIKQLSLNSD